MPGKGTSSAKGRGLIPPWIISLFVSSHGSCSGAVIIKTTGGVQIAFSAFVIVFSTLVGAAFFFDPLESPSGLLFTRRIRRDRSYIICGNACAGSNGKDYYQNIRFAAGRYGDRQSRPVRSFV